MPDLRSKLLLADAFHAPGCGRIETLTQALFAIDADGVIAALYRRDAPGYAEALAAASASSVFVE